MTAERKRRYLLTGCAIVVTAGVAIYIAGEQFGAIMAAIAGAGAWMGGIFIRDEWNY